MDRCIGGWVGGWMDKWMGRQVDGWMGGEEVLLGEIW